jgi:uncharacterized protein (TIGR02594 family)
MPLAAPSVARVTAPAWFIAAQKELGVRELPENRGPAIRRYIEMAHCGHEGDAWCAIFLNAMLESVGIKGTRSASSQSFRNTPDFVKITGPALGAIVVYWRISRVSGLGHVGFYNGEDSHGFIETLGGNESDMVRNELLNPNGQRFGLVGFYWPKAYAPPVIGKLPVQALASAGTGKVV